MICVPEWRNLFSISGKGLKTETRFCHQAFTVSATEISPLRDTNLFISALSLCANTTGRNNASADCQPPTAYCQLIYSNKKDCEPSPYSQSFLYSLWEPQAYIASASFSFLLAVVCIHAPAFISESIAFMRRYSPSMRSKSSSLRV